MSVTQDLVNSLAKLTEEISKLTASHTELRKDVQAVHETSKSLQKSVFKWREN